MYNPNTYYQQTMKPMSPATPTMYGLKGRPVSSLDEVRASSIDFDGSVFFFPDLANKRIYTKQINMDGTAILNMYELKEMPLQQNTIQGDFITRKEFEEVINSLRGSLAMPSQPAQEPTENTVFNF